MSDSRPESNSPSPGLPGPESRDRQSTGSGRPHSIRDQAPDQQFWHLWRQGRRPDLRSFLSGQGVIEPARVAAVVAIDQYERWLAGERVAAEDYLALLPAGPDADQAACDIVYGEYLLREQLGEHPSLEEYCRRFPVQAGLLARQVELHKALASESPEDDEAPAGKPNTFARSRALKAEPTAPSIPGYEVLEEIGRGGMGVVYKAKQSSLNRLVALKVLDVIPGRDPVALDRMRREAQVMARLSHPHIVTVHDAGQAGNHFYFAMEYVSGVDLHRLVDQSGPLPAAQACEYMRQAAMGLQHAHEQGLVHRDIKPSNLIVTTPGPKDSGDARGSTLKVLDLGLARLTEPMDQPAAPITQVGAFMGTPDFVAPEQANDARAADIRSDLYSLGCTFYYVLTGHAPFAGATPLAKLMQHHLSDPPALADLRPDLPPTLSGLIRKLMAKRPEERFATPAELVRALDRVQAGSAPPSPSPVAPAPAPAVQERATRAGLVRRFNGHTDWVKCVAFAPVGDLIASGSLDRSVRLWSVGRGLETRCVRGHSSAVLCLAFSPVGNGLVSGGQDRLLCLWDVATGRELWRAAGHGDNVNGVAFSGDGSKILSASHDGTLRLWDAVPGRQVRAWSGHDGPVWSVAVSSCGRLALSGGQDRMIRLWNVDTGESLLALPEQAMIVTSVALTPDGRHALSGGMDGLVRLWDLTRQREVRIFEGHAARVTSVAFSGDGRRAASGSRDRSLRIWDVETGRERFSFTGHTHWVTSVAWSPDGTRVVSGSVDRTVCVWEVPE